MQINKVKSSNSSYNFALSQIFSPALLKKIHSPSDEQTFKDLLDCCNLYPLNEDWCLVKGLEITYNYLKENYRCEYVYKNEIANQILLKFHSDNSATLLKEVASCSSIADIVIINGNTVAYEIKTELDSFERLPSQIESYRMLYDYLYIVTHPKAVKTLSTKIDDGIGIMVLDTDGILKIVQEATLNKDMFNPINAVLTLRQSELVKAYEKYAGKMPVMGTGLVYNFCYKWYINLDKYDAQKIFSESLKFRKPSVHQFELIKKCNPALKMMFLGNEISKKTCITTINKLCTFD